MKSGVHYDIDEMVYTFLLVSTLGIIFCYLF